MISRILFWSAQAAVILSARFGPIPSTSRRRAGLASMMSKTSVPNRRTIRVA